jgi:hypothetical protein
VSQSTPQANPRRGRSLRQLATGRELAVLADGPWLPAWYWRNELEAAQAAAQRYPDGHPSAVLAGYYPTDEWRAHPSGEDVEGRVWRHRPCSSASGSDSSTGD